ncbi:unnamed protein product [Wickerhamomyces anomalus]
MSIIPKESLFALEHEFGIIKLIHHRNKNQHRVATWWKHLNNLKRYLTKVISLIHTYNHKKDDKVRQKLQNVSRHLYFNICKSAFRAFNGVIALGQFITLGLTLVGALGKIYHHVGTVDGLHKTGTLPGKVDDTVDYNEGDIGEEIGEEVGEVVVIKTQERKRKSVEPVDTSIKKKKKAVKSISDNESVLKKKKKKKKNAIDDIFG